MNDLLTPSNASAYDASSIQVLEDMEHVRLRPGMYIGGKDDRALHHMVAEIIDNSMDEAVAGHATWIEVELHENGHVSVRDNGAASPSIRIPRIRARPHWKSSSARSTQAASFPATAIRPRAGCMASALRWSTRFPIT